MDKVSVDIGSRSKPRKANLPRHGKSSYQPCKFVITMIFCKHKRLLRYHVPRAFLKPTGNLLVLLEEENGDPLKVSLDKISVAQVCGHVSETHLPPVVKWLGLKTHNQNNTRKYRDRRPKVQLSCPPKRNISKVLFASFGNPSGDCQNYSTGSCHSSISTAIVEQVSITYRFTAVSELHFVAPKSKELTCMFLMMV